jgi:hypothetical protein
MEQPIDLEKAEPVCRSFTEFFFYKLDRTMAIVGIVLLSGGALYLRTPETIAAACLGIGALATYIGNRAGK